MSLETDRFLDRRRLKRQLTVWRVATVVAVAAAVFAVISRYDRVAVPGDHVARLDVVGLILSDPDRDEVLRDVADDDSAKALMIVVNSPGGSYVGGESLFEAIRKVAERKPVVAVMEDTATSAAYMTAIAGERIFARQGSLTGSIGVIVQSADVTGLLDRIGVKPETVKSSPLKAQPNPMEPFTDEARASIQAVVGELHSLFIDMVADRRGMEPEAARRLADGRIFSGRQAVANGLVDAIGGEDEALDWLAEAKGLDAELPVRDVTPRDEAWPLLDLLEGAFGKALFSERLRLDGLISVWHPSL